MTPSFRPYNTTFITASGSGVIGATGKAIYLQGVYNSQASGQGFSFFSGTAAVTMALCTFPTKTYVEFPMAFPNGCTYQTNGNPGDADLRTVFFWIPGSTT